MLTGELRNQIDRIWDAFWSGGIANPLEVMEQLTYLLFIKGLDERQTLAERKASRTGKPIDVVEKDTDRDYFMSADESVAYGIADKVLESGVR